MDTWLPEQVKFMEGMGNKKAAEYTYMSAHRLEGLFFLGRYWEANYNGRRPEEPGKDLERFIRFKYEDKRFVAAAPQQRYIN